MVLNVFKKNFAAIDFGGAFGGDGGARGIVGGDDGANAACRIERGHAQKLRMRAEEMFALRERDGMRLDGGEAVERGVRRSDQVKRDGMNDFGDDVKTALEKQIVGSVNGARESILDRRQGVVGGAFGDCRKERFKRRTRNGFDVFAEEAHGGLFAEGSALALEGDAGNGVCGGHLGRYYYSAFSVNPHLNDYLTTSRQVAQIAARIGTTLQGQGLAVDEVSCARGVHVSGAARCGVGTRAEEGNCAPGGVGILFAIRNAHE